jgi:osmoprotectant transport system permease protein
MVWTFLSEHAGALQQKVLEHLFLSSLSLLLASTLAIPLGISIFRFASLRKILLPIGSVSQTIPSLALLGLLIPFLGLGTLPTIVALTFYGIYPLLKNTYAGLKAVPAECLEAAEGLGFSPFQRLWFVELPLALPLIIAGLRVAMSMTIGIASIAALIGAGGLGDFIMQGIALNNSSLILLGAIPAAFLAIAFDYTISLVEVRLKKRKEGPPLLLKFQKSYLVLFGLLILGGGSLFYDQAMTNEKENTIVIASKNFTESIILAEMMAQVIEAKTSLAVKRKFNLGTTDIIHQALLKREVDLYPEYTGTAYMTVLKKALFSSGGSLFQKVRQAYKDNFQLMWLAPFGFSNSQTLVITRAAARQYNIYTLSDLGRLSSSLSLAATPEFLKRDDGVPLLLKAYGLTFKAITQVDPTLMYLAISNKVVDVIAAFATDGKLQKYELIPLTDDKRAFPAYEAAPVIRLAVLKVYPELQDILAPLAGAITQDKMRTLNYQVDVEGKSPSAIVRAFLSSVM